VRALVLSENSTDQSMYLKQGMTNVVSIDMWPT
jgi:hypothetical protein